jgi:hypothetical protein
MLQMVLEMFSRKKWDKKWLLVTLLGLSWFLISNAHFRRKFWSSISRKLATYLHRMWLGAFDKLEDFFRCSGGMV